MEMNNNVQCPPNRIQMYKMSALVTRVVFWVASTTAEGVYAYCW